MTSKAVVLGARIGSGNIGEAVVNRLNEDGWEADGNDCQVQGPERPKGALQLGGTGLSYERYDAPSYQWLAAGDYDACVITLGVTHMAPFDLIKEQDLLKVLRGSLELPLIAARRYVSGRAAAGKGGKLVLTGSYAHRHPFTNGTAYCVAKAGVEMAVRTLGWELTDKGFRVFGVHPFHVRGTPMWRQVEEGVMRTKNMTYEEADEYNRRDLKMPDLCTPDEVAGTIAWLLSDPSAEWLSGTSIELNGGAR